jgi:cell division protease FtsH
MSGADLSNLVNEAALFAVRAGDESIHMRHFEMARDRVLMGQRRESMALSDAEKEAVAYHEAGHAVCAAVLPHADPVHKVTILPTGMALGVTQQLPIEERHIYRQDYIEDRLVVAMGGRKMVREWGMSGRIGPMAWGSQGQVFLGEDLMHTRDYSDETARVIDEEVEKILREQEDRCRVVLGENRHGLDLVARALMEHETIDGDEVQRLIGIGRTGAPIESVVTRGADETRFSKPSPAVASNGGNGAEEPSPSPSPAPAPAIIHTPPS